MIQNEYYITFSHNTMKILTDNKIEFKKRSNDNKAKKMGWYFLITEIKEIMPEFFTFIENAKKDKQKYNRKQKTKKKQNCKYNPVSKKNKFYDEKKTKENVITWKIIKLDQQIENRHQHQQQKR